MDTQAFARQIVAALEDKKAENILLLEITGVSVLADYFVIANGTSERQLKALAEAVGEVSAPHIKRRVVLRRADEQAENGWILVDLGDVIVHLFSPSQRKFYNLEGLWKEAKVLLRVQ